MELGRLAATDRAHFRSITGLNWISHAKILVTPERVNVGEKAEKQIVAVCDTPFSNLPRRFFGRAPHTHAVAYADGSTGLLSVDEFKKLDLRGFVDVRTIPSDDKKPEGATNDSQTGAVPNKITSP